MIIRLLDADSRPLYEFTLQPGATRFEHRELHGQLMCLVRGITVDDPDAGSDSPRKILEDFVKWCGRRTIAPGSDIAALRDRAEKLAGFKILSSDQS